MLLIIILWLRLRLLVSLLHRLLLVEKDPAIVERPAFVRANNLCLDGNLELLIRSRLHGLAWLPRRLNGDIDWDLLREQMFVPCIDQRVILVSRRQHRSFLLALVPIDVTLSLRKGVLHRECRPHAAFI